MPARGALSVLSLPAVFCTAVAVTPQLSNRVGLLQRLAGSRPMHAAPGRFARSELTTEILGRELNLMPLTIDGHAAVG